MSLIEKIDTEEKKQIKIWKKNSPYTYEIQQAYLFGLRKAKEIILAEQNKPLTKGDKIRESNESLAEWYTEKTNNVLEQLGTGWRAEKEKILDRLNQPQEDTK